MGKGPGQWVDVAVKSDKKKIEAEGPNVEGILGWFVKPQERRKKKS